MKREAHKLSTSPEYRCWSGMKSRCYKPSATGYERYGGRGIVVCERWHSFKNFIADMGRRPSPSHSIDRIDNDGHYEPGNCRWATSKQQNRNKGMTKVAAFGEVKLVAEWAEDRRSLVSRNTLVARLHRGCEPEAAMTIPAGESSGIAMSASGPRPLNEAQREIAQRAVDYARANWRNLPSLDEIAAVAGGSPFHLHRLVSRHAGTTLKAIVAAEQVEAAKVLMLNGTPLPEVAANCGFTHHAHFTHRFKQATGLPPLRWMRLKRGGSDDGGGAAIQQGV